jgi:hypothetical protein
MNTRAFLLSALVAGLVMGLLGNLPLLNLINCILCLWIWLGGFCCVPVPAFHTSTGLTVGQGLGLGPLLELMQLYLGPWSSRDQHALHPLMNSLALLCKSRRYSLYERWFLGIAGQVIFFLISTWCCTRSSAPSAG